jgi:hypothetical protein
MGVRLVANRFVQAPSHGGSFRAGQPTIIVIHSLEAPARRGLAWDLANGWIQTAGVSPHSMTDPGETVDLLSLSTVGWHCGNGNQVGIGLEVTGYAAWSFAQWTTGDAFAAVRLDAKRAAEVAARFGIPIRWLSLAQIRNGERGFCTHADISATLGGTNHTDPGKGFPFAIFLQMVQQWTDGTIGNPSRPPNPQPGEGPGGAQPKEWDEMASKEEIRAVVAEEVARQVTPQIINDVVANVLRAPEFDLSKGKIVEHRQEDVFNAVVGVLHAPEFAGWQERTRAAADKILSDAPKA